MRNAIREFLGSRTRERGEAIVVGLIMGLSCSLLRPTPEQLDGFFTTVVPTMISTAAILAGFQATALSLVLVLYDAAVIRRLRESGAFRHLVGYYKEASWGLLGFVFLGVVAMGLHTLGSPIPRETRIVPPLLGGTFAWAMAATIRLNRLMVYLTLFRDDG